MKKKKRQTKIVRAFCFDHWHQQQFWPQVEKILAVSVMVKRSRRRTRSRRRRTDNQETVVLTSKPCHTCTEKDAVGMMRRKKKKGRKKKTKRSQAAAGSGCYREVRGCRPTAPKKERLGT